MQAGLLDELIVYMAPALMGDRARPLLQLPLEAWRSKVPAADGGCAQEWARTGVSPLSRSTRNTREQIMFTGIIQAVGEVAAMQPSGGDLRLRVNTGKLDLERCGAGRQHLHQWCLPDGDRTARRWLLGRRVGGDSELHDPGRVEAGSRVNLEKALTPASRLGGHIVSGHVDGVGEVVSLQEDARSWRFVLRAPDDLAKYIAHKGSIWLTAPA